MLCVYGWPSYGAWMQKGQHILPRWSQVRDNCYLPLIAYCVPFEKEAGNLTLTPALPVPQDWGQEVGAMHPDLLSKYKATFSVSFLVLSFRFRVREKYFICEQPVVFHTPDPYPCLKLAGQYDNKGKASQGPWHPSLPLVTLHRSEVVTWPHLRSRRLGNEVFGEMNFLDSLLSHSGCILSNFSKCL